MDWDDVVDRVILALLLALEHADWQFVFGVVSILQIFFDNRLKNDQNQTDNDGQA